MLHQSRYMYYKDNFIGILFICVFGVFRLLHVNPAYRMNIQDLTIHPWLNDAPDVQLHSPAVFSDKVKNIPKLVGSGVYIPGCLYRKLSYNLYINCLLLYLE